MTTKKAVLIAVGIIGALALVVAIVAGGILGYVFYTLDHSDAAKTAKTFLRENQKLKQEIGEVRDFGWFTTGSVSALGALGNAELHLKTVGERESVNATVVLSYRNGHDWRVVDAYYDDATGKRVFLTKTFDDNADAPASNGEGDTEQSDGTDDNAKANSNDGEGGGVEKFDEESFSDNVLRAEEPVLVTLGSPTNQDSRELDKTLDEIAPKYEERIGLVRYDVSNQPELLNRFEAKTVPTLILFKNGAEVERREGKLSTSEVSRLLDKYLKP
jgi:thioredoxin 1